MYLNKKQLIERGWSPKLIKDFLGEPDDVKPLGRYCEEHRYWLPRVERIEQLEDFKAAQTVYLARRSRGQETAKKQAAQRLEAAKTMVIRIKRLSEDEILQEAIEHFNRRRVFRRFEDDDFYEFTLADENSDRQFLHRITVNYIRHNLTRYDSHLLQERGRIGGGDAVPIIRRRVYEEIACAYPQLADECDRQMLQRGLKSESELKSKGDYVQLELFV